MVNSQVNPDYPIVIVLALGIDEGPLIPYKVGATLGHELVHVVDPNCDLADLPDYGVLITEFAEAGVLDDNTGLARRRDERIPMVFEGSMFGIDYNMREDSEDEAALAVYRWRRRYSPLGELMIRDQNIVFNYRRRLRARAIITKDNNIRSSTTPHTPLKPKPGAVKPKGPRRRRRLGFPYYSWERLLFVRQDPNRLGVYRWVIRQARQAERDPGRVWGGAVAELRRLLDGLHPDGDPAEAICPQDPGWFDPDVIDIERDEFEVGYGDWAAEILRKIPQCAKIYGLPLVCGQLTAAICGDSIESWSRSFERDDAEAIRTEEMKRNGSFDRKERIALYEREREARKANPTPRKKVGERPVLVWEIPQLLEMDGIPLADFADSLPSWLLDRFEGRSPLGG